MLDKRKLLEECIRRQEKRIEDLKQSLESTRRAAIEAPSSRESWSDTTKFQKSNLALAIQRQLGEAELALSQLKTISADAKDAILAGALFILKWGDNGEIKRYFLIPVGGGLSFSINGIEVLLISTSAPLAEVVLGKKKGERINFQNRVLEIIEVR